MKKNILIPKQEKGNYGRPIFDKNKDIYNFRETQTGAILRRGNREIYLNYKSVNAGEKAKKYISDKSFNQIYNHGKKVKLLGTNTSYIDFNNK